ncbi:unnamed protein product [Ambrosiozyma monospora]|uniref:threonine--tRNA ligase n=1 Tax=Ambrosiozyma monospora TaxID=43982 RepID=A0A9W6Z4E4_AMBMO|nr:unnamed protein product [Ambrosiozyma monospora]
MSEEVTKKVESLSVDDKAAPVQAKAPVDAEKEQQHQHPNGEKKQKKDKKKGANESARSLYVEPQPEFIDHRIKIFEQLKAKADAEFAKKERVPIKITLKDGAIKEGTSYETSPFEIAKAIGKSFLERQVISKVNGELWDLERPFEGDAKLEFFDFETDEGKQVFWHSSAHVLGEEY